ncbi:MAG: effector-binding domain-containing protein [Lysobacterales bacterium]|jgi:effector-binding domain-containing protein
MLKKLLFATLFVITAFVVGGFLLPDEYHVERSVVVERPASVVFALLNSYKSFNQWSPWAARDPGAQYVFSGPEDGPGAKMSWKGDPRTLGEGWQEITRSEPNRRIEIYLDFGEQGIARSYYAIKEMPVAETADDNQFKTEVSWGFNTNVSEGKGIFGALMGRYFGLLLDKWVGADYQQGMSAFKQFAETLPATDFTGSRIEIVTAEAAEILFVSGISSQDASDIAQALGTAFAEIGSFMTENDIQINGQPMAITRSWDENGYRFDAALPVDQVPEVVTGNVQSGFSPAGKAVRYTHVGPYDAMLPAYEELASFMVANGLKEGPISWEHYISDPGDTLEAEIITHIYFLIEE